MSSGQEAGHVGNEAGCLGGQAALGGTRFRLST